MCIRPVNDIYSSHAITLSKFDNMCISKCKALRNVLQLYAYEEGELVESSLMMNHFKMKQLFLQCTIR